MKIDLEEIKPLVDEMQQRYQDAKEYGDEMDIASFGYQYGQVYSHDNIIKIADALEQLPKLVAALQSAQSDLEYHFTNVGEQPPSLFEAKQALEPFTNQPQP